MSNNDEIDFREKYLWWRKRPGARTVEAPDYIERAYDAAHPPAVTPEEVLRQLSRYPDGGIHQSEATNLPVFWPDSDTPISYDSARAIAGMLLRLEAERQNNE